MMSAASDVASAPPSFQGVRSITTTTGFVVQGWIVGHGGIGRNHIVQICTVADGQIASCEEYIAPEMNIGNPLRDEGRR